MAIDDRIEH